jgi:hypothetical protein
VVAKFGPEHVDLELLRGFRHTQKQQETEHGFLKANSCNGVGIGNKMPRVGQATNERTMIFNTLHPLLETHQKRAE